jgi:hypothetical protein
MPAYARHVIVADDEVGIYHCIARCVRRAFLCGTDPVTGHNAPILERLYLKDDR